MGIHLYEAYRIDKLMETESRIMVAGTGEGGNNYLMGTEFPFGKMKKVLETERVNLGRLIRSSSLRPL